MDSLLDRNDDQKLTEDEFAFLPSKSYSLRFDVVRYDGHVCI